MMKLENGTIDEKIRNCKYKGLIGAEAVNACYVSSSRRFADNPITNFEILFSWIRHREYASLCDMYFHINPEEAQKIVNEYEVLPLIKKMFTGLLETNCKKAQRKSAYNAVRRTRINLQNNIHYINFD